MDEFDEIADHRFCQYKEGAPAIDVDGQTFFIGPRGLGTEDPDTSSWCTRCPATCEVILPPGRITKASQKYMPRFGREPRMSDYPIGTCMILPPDRCRHLPVGIENWEGWYES